MRNFREVGERPQTAIREMFPTLERSTAGSRRVSATPRSLSAHPPMLGLHAERALADLPALAAPLESGR